jgi:hypothetical protein
MAAAIAATLFAAVPTIFYADFAGIPILILFGGIPFFIGYLLVTAAKPSQRSAAADNPAQKPRRAS